MQLLNKDKIHLRTALKNCSIFRAGISGKTICVRLLSCYCIFDCTDHTKLQLSENICLFPGQITFYLAMESPDYFLATFSKYPTRSQLPSIWSINLFYPIYSTSISCLWRSPTHSPKITKSNPITPTLDWLRFHWSTLCYLCRHFKAKLGLNIWGRICKN